MAPLRYMLSIRDDTATSSATSPSSSTHPSPPRAPMVPRSISWLAVGALLCCVIAGILLSLRARLAQRRRKAELARIWGIQEKPRASTEKLLRPGWKKRPFAVSIPPPAYTAVGDNIAPGQEDAVFRTTRDQRRALYVLYKPLTQSPPSPKFYW